MYRKRKSTTKIIDSENSLDVEELNASKEMTLWRGVQQKIVKEKKINVIVSFSKLTFLLILILGGWYLLFPHKDSMSNLDLYAFLRNVESRGLPHKGDGGLFGDIGKNWQLSEIKNNNIKIKGDQTIIYQNDTLKINGVSDKKKLFFVQAPYRSKLTIVMNDGTSVMLNANSTLVFNSDYTKGDRSMALEGTGRFSIIHDIQRPMFLVTGKDTVYDIGTIFYARYFSASNATNVAVQDGIVDFKNMTVKAGEMTIKMNNQYKKYLYPKTQMDDLYLNTHEFVFSEEPIDQIVGQIANWYGVKTQIPNNANFETFTGRIPKDLPIESVIELIKDISNEELQLIEIKGQQTILLTKKITMK